jgi:hypothetical protein
LLAIIFTLNQEDSGETTITDFLHDFVILWRIFLRKMSGRFQLWWELLLRRQLHYVVILVLGHLTCSVSSH